MTSPSVLRISRAEVVEEATTILELNGTPHHLAVEVAESLVGAQEVGHASHGLIRLLEYTKFVEKGQVIPHAEPAIVTDNGSAIVIDGNWGWGQIACKLAVDLAVERAAVHGVMGITIRSCNHIGRLGEYVELLAEQKLVSLMWCNADPAVAAFGGTQRLLGTNPFASGIPTDQKPLVLDFATSASAEGKIRVARANGQQVKPGQIIDKDGKPSTNPNDFYDGGALLPFGEHKGYGMSLMIELLGGALSGNHPSINDNYVVGNGAVLLVINPAKFIPYGEFLDDVVQASNRIRQSPPSDPAFPVMMPGDLENSIKAKNGGMVVVDEPIWASIISLKAELQSSH